jgi:hypothetical protein
MQLARNLKKRTQVVSGRTDKNDASGHWFSPMAIPHQGHVMTSTGSTMLEPTPLPFAAVYLSNATPTATGNRAERYASLQEVLRTLALFPDDDGFHLEKEVADRASDFLGFLSENVNIDAPLFFPQDGDAAVFTWDFGAVKRLLTLDVDEASSQDIHKRTFVRCRHDFGDADYYTIMSELGATLSPSSTSVEGNAK